MGSVSLPLKLVLGLLLTVYCAAQTGQAPSTYFITPPASAQAGFYVEDIVYQLNSNLSVHWVTNQTAYGLFLFQQQSLEYAALGDSIYIHNEGDPETGGFVWNVTTQNFAINESPVFFLSLAPNGTLTSEAFTSHYFNISVQISPSVTSTTATSTSTSISSSSTISSTGPASSNPVSSIMAVAPKPTNTANTSSNTGSAVGLGVGLGVSIPIILFLIALGLFCCCQKRRKRLVAPTPQGMSAGVPQGAKHVHAGMGELTGMEYELPDHEHVAEMPGQSHRLLPELPAR